MENTLATLTVVVGVLAILQGWQMIQSRRRRNNNPSVGDIGDQLSSIDKKLGGIGGQMGRMEQRLNDIWDKVK